MEKNIYERHSDLFDGFFKLEKFQDKMTEEEIDIVFYVTDGFLDKYIHNVRHCIGSLNFIINNGIEEIEEKLTKYEKHLENLNKKFL